MYMYIYMWLMVVHGPKTADNIAKMYYSWFLETAVHVYGYLKENKCYDTSYSSVTYM